VTHTGRIPFGLASFVVKKMFLCKVDHCGVEQNSPRLGGKHLIYVIVGLKTEVNVPKSTYLLRADPVGVLQVS
jgi:hypothetical protein